MLIKVVRIKTISAGKLKAFVDVDFGGVVVKGAKIFEGTNGLFASLPSQKSPKDDKYYDIVSISDEVLKSEFVKAVLDAYKEQSKNVAPTPEQLKAVQDAGLVSGDQEVPF